MELKLKNSAYNFKIKNITYKLIKDLKPKDKIIYTDMGNFKIRKNGRYRLRIGSEVIRITPFSNSCL